MLIICLLFDSVPTATNTTRRTDNGDVTIDLLVVWTEKAERRNARNCNVNDSTKLRMENLIQLAIEESNVAFKNSGVGIILIACILWNYYLITVWAELKVIDLVNSLALYFRRDNFCTTVLEVEGKRFLRYSILAQSEAGQHILYTALNSFHYHNA